MDSEPDQSRLVCPACAREHGSSERFCEECGMPLVHPDATEGEVEEVDPRREYVRKVKPQYSEGALVKVAYAGSLPEAELIQGLLLEEGIPSMVRRAPGFDVPDFLAGGPRDVLVPESGAEAARQALNEQPPSPG